MRNVVLFGPPLSGKGTLLYAFAERHHVPVINRVAGSHDTAPILAVVTLGETRFTTIPGSPWSTSDWDPLLQSADAVVAVFDLQRAREKENRTARQQLEPFIHGRGHLAVLTKADLRSRFDRDEAIEMYRLDGWRVFISRAAAPAIDALEMEPPCPSKD